MLQNPPAPPPTAPHRNILLFSDGTGNSSGKLFRTNVWRLYKAADLEDPQNPAHPRQFAFYDNGVGTSSFRPLAVLGGAFGVGLARNVRDLYSFVCRTYRPGDQIYVFGFSRGAFTVRVLVGLMVTQGLVPYNGSEADLQHRVAAAYRAYRRERFNTTGGLVAPIRWIRDRLINLWTRKPYRPEENRGHPGYDTPLRIRFVGVWDTVAAYGLPVDELTRAVDDYIWPLSMPDRDLSPRVERAMHALSLDDERNTFHPQLWNEGPPKRDPSKPPPNPGPPAGHIHQERLSQVWFAGVHSDVGGGYPDDGISYVSLEWIMEEADRAGVRFVPEIWKDYRALSDENGPINDSRSGLGGYYRYNPRRIERLAETDEVTVKDIKIHESVLRRIQVGQDGYAPIAIPPDYRVVRIDGSIVDAGTYLDQVPEKLAAARTAGPVPGPYDPNAYRGSREQVYNLVWWRRIAYFWTLIATLLLVFLPLVAPARPDGACQSGACFLSAPIGYSQAVLPGAAATWIETFASRPGWLLLLATAIVLGLGVGAWLEVRIRDAMRLIWYAIPATTPVTPRAFPASPKIDEWGKQLAAFRTSQGYRRTVGAMTHWVLPAFFLGGVIYAAIALLSQAAFSIHEATGGLCQSTSGATRVTERHGPVPIWTGEPCADTGLLAEEGASYRITAVIPKGHEWWDDTLPAGPHGVDPDKTSGLAPFVPLRRHLGQPWFKPMVRIGMTGSDAYPFDPKPAMVPPRGRKRLAASIPHVPPECGLRDGVDVTVSSEITARSSGAIFFYVNDAIPLFSGIYRNNRGTACLYVELIAPPPVPTGAKPVARRN